MTISDAFRRPLALLVAVAMLFPFLAVSSPEPALAAEFTGTVDASGDSLEFFDVDAAGAARLTNQVAWESDADLDMFVRRIDDPTSPNSGPLVGSSTTGANPEAITLGVSGTGQYRVYVIARSGAANFTLDSQPRAAEDLTWQGTLDQPSPRFRLLTVPVATDGTVTATMELLSGDANLYLLRPDGRLRRATGDPATTSVFADVGDGGGLARLLVLATSPDVSYEITADVNAAPTVEDISDLSLQSGDTADIDVITGDADGDDTLTVTVDGLPDGLDYDADAGAITGTVANAVKGGSPYDVTVTVDDDTDSDETSFTITIDNSLPTIAPIDPVEVEATVDIDPIDVVTEDLDGDDVTVTTAGLPDGLIYDDTTGQITGAAAVSAVAPDSPYTVTVAADDDGDPATGEAVTTFDVTVLPAPNIAPVFTEPVPGDQTVTQNQQIDPLEFTASDEDGDPLTFEVEGLPAGLLATSPGANTLAISGTPTEAGAFDVTVSVSDGTATTTTGLTLTVDSFVPLAFADVADQSIQAGTSVTIPIELTGDAADGATIGAPPDEDLPDGLVYDEAAQQITGTPTDEAVRAEPYEVSFVAFTGDEAADLVFSLTITAAPNEAPTIAITDPPATVAEGQDVTIPVDVDDADGDPLTVTADNVPNGLQVVYDETTDTFSITGTVDNGTAAGSPYAISLEVADDNGASASTSFTLAVTDPAPTIGEIEDQTFAEGDDVTIPINATDPDGDALTVSANLPAGLEVAADGSAITGQLAAGTASTYSINVSVNDGTSTVSTTFTLIVDPANTAPSIDPIGDVDAVEDQAIDAFTLSATDADGDGFTFTVSGLPAGVTFDGADTISGTPEVGTAAGSPYTVSVTATDDSGEGNSSTTSFQVAVGEKPNELPTITPIDDQTVTEGGFVSIDVDADDPDNFPNAELAVSVDDLPTGVSYSDGLISGIPATATAGNYAVTVTANDGADTATEEFTLTVSGPNQAPVITDAATGEAPAPQTATIGEDFSLVLNADDPENDPIDLFDVSTLPDGLTVTTDLTTDPATATISGQPTASAVDTTVLVTVETQNGQQTNTSFDIDIIEGEDSTPPSAVALTADGAEGQVDLSWTGGTDDSPVTFDVYRGTTPGVDSVTGTPIIEDTTSPVSDTDVVADTTYYYVVVATDEADNSTTSNEDVAIPFAPAQPCTPVSTLECDQLAVTTPYALDFDGTEGGLSDTGFTLVDDPSLRDSVDQAPAPATPTFPDVPGFEPSLLSVDGDALTITATKGIQYAQPSGSGNGLQSSGTVGTNAQLNGLGVAVPGGQDSYELSTTLVAPNFNSGGGSQQGGLWWFLDEDNYIKLVVVRDNDTTNHVQLAVESFDDPTADDPDGFLELNGPTFTSGQDVALQMQIDAATGLVTASYTVADGTEVALSDGGDDDLIVPAGLTDGQALADGLDPTINAGVFATKRSAPAGNAVSATFADFAVDAVAPVVELTADPTALTASVETGGTASGSIAVDAANGTVEGVSVTNDQPWLTAVTDGTTTPLAVDVDVDATGLSAGTYDGTVTITGTDVEDLVVPVSLTVTATAAPCYDISTLPCADVDVELPFAVDFDGTEGGLDDVDDDGTGFTMVQAPSNQEAGDPDPTVAEVPGYVAGQLDVAAGDLTIAATNGLAFRQLASQGDPNTTNSNSQQNTLGVGFDASSGPFTLETTVDVDFPGNANFQQSGLWFGLDEDNYVKVVARETNDAGTQAFEILREIGADEGDDSIVTSTVPEGPVTLTLDVDPSDGSLVATYDLVGGGSGDIGSFDATPQSFFDGVALPDGASGTASFAGVFASARRASVANRIDATFSDFSITPEATGGNEAPEFGNLPNRSATEGQAFRAPVPTSDPEGGNVTVSLSDGPDWLSWDAAQGVLLGDVPAEVGGATTTIEVTATDDDGAAATATFELELLDALSIDVNFQADGVPTPSGYLADFGQSFGSRGEPSAGLSYGWVDPATGDPQSMVGNARDRDRTGVDQLNDTIIHMQYGDIGTVYDGNPNCTTGVCDEGSWEIALPNGAYEVTLAVGDEPGGQDVYDSLHAINLESVAAIEGFQGTTDQEYLEVTTQVGVADGALTVTAEGGANTKIDYIEIDSLGQLPFAVTPNPENRSDGALLDTNVSTSVSVPGAGYGVDPSVDSVNTDTIKLFEIVDGGSDQEIPATFGSTGGNDTISVAAANNLEPNTSYRFVIDGVVDENGYEFLPYTSLFTTGDDSSTGGGDETFEPVEGIDFESVDLGVDDKYFSTLKVHEGYLWATTATGQGMFRYPILDDGTLGPEQAINAMGGRAAIGMIFDQDDPTVAWVTNATDNTSSESSQFSSKVTRVDFGDDLDNAAAVMSPAIDDVIVGLPRSLKDHLSNSLAYGPSGDGGSDWLYFMQGSNQAAGSADSAWGTRGETALTAAVLRFDPQDAWNTVQPTGQPIDVQTEDGGTYDPFADGAPLEVYASGIRNAYDLLFHSNGHLYVPTNGTAGGGNSAVNPGVDINGSTLTQTAAYTDGGAFQEVGRDVTDVCADDRIDGQPYTGPEVPSVTHPTQRDFLFDVEEGGYYGHPNPDRCEWVLNNGGDPVFGGNDGTGYGPDVDPDPNYRGFAYNFEFNKSPNGVIEYTSDTFGGALQGRMMVVRFSGNNDILTMQVADDGEVLGAQGGEEIGGFKERANGQPYNDPLDVTEDTEVNPGNLYLNQYARSNAGAQKLFLLRVPEDQQAADLDVETTQPAAVGDDLVMSATLNNEGPTDTDTVTLTNNGTESADVTGTVSGADAGQFSLDAVGSIPSGGSVDVEVTFDPSGASPGVRTATLEFATADATVTLDVRALAHTGQEGGEEPTLQQVFDTFDLGLDSGWSGLAGGTNPAPVGDEVDLDLFERASDGPVIATPVAAFAPFEDLPFGWYADTTGTPSYNELGLLPNGQQQTLVPDSDPAAPLAFDPGTDAFGFYYDSNTFGRKGFTEDARNLDEPDNQGVSHRARVYPLPGDAYYVAFEDSANGDYQDYDFILENVVAAGEAPDPDPEPTGDAVQVNFQSEDAPLPAGYLRDFGQAYGARTDADQGDGLTYGWVDDETFAPLDLVGNGRDRDSNDDQRLDTLMHMDLPPEGQGGVLQDGSWELALAEGSYEVTVSVGDPDLGGADETHVINVEGVETIAGFPKSTAPDGSDARHQQATVQVEVVDGNLTIDQIDGTNTKINYLEVTPLSGGGDTVAQVNFQPAGSPTPTDWVADSGELFTGARGYGWVDTEGGATKAGDTRDRPADTDPLDGTLMIVDDGQVDDVVNGDWEYALAEGTYQVTVSVGDPEYADSTHGVTAEGTSLVSGFTPAAAGDYDTGTASVEVTDGALTLSSTGTNTKFQWVQIAASGDGSDVIPPRVEISLDGQGDGGVFTGDVDVDLDITDATLEFVDVIVDGTPLDAVNASNYGDGFTVSGAGSHTIAVTATDGAGNSTTETATFEIIELGDGDLTLDNPEDAPFEDRLVMSRIQNSNGTSNSSETAQVVIGNNGTESFDIASLATTDDDFEVVGPTDLPVPVSVGDEVTVEVQFVGVGSGGNQNFESELVIGHDASDGPTTVVELAGSWQFQEEGGREPSLAQIAELYGLGTTIVGPGQSINNQGRLEAIGDEVLSEYWERADKTEPVAARQLAAYHGAPGANSLRWHPQGNKGGGQTPLTHDGDWAQTLRPRINGSDTAPAATTFTPGPDVFALAVSNESSAWTTNNAGPDSCGSVPQDECTLGHHFRLWQAEDRDGDAIPNTYVATMDFSGINYDFQDNVYLISNIVPEGQADETPPEAPTGLTASGGDPIVTLDWDDNAEADVAEYLVQRSSGGAYSTIATVTDSEHVDGNAPTGTTLSYRAVAVDTSGNESAPSAPAEITTSGDAQTVVHRINAGGPAVTDLGVAWDADRDFDGGGPFVNGSAQVSTLYQTERSGGSDLAPFAYDLPVADGTYTVNLHLAEIYFGATGGGATGADGPGGERIFSVNLEGGPVELADYDINDDVGPETPIVQSFVVEVDDGQLDLDFTASLNQPKVSAIEVLTSDGGPGGGGSDAIRINAGGPEVTTGGVTWAAQSFGTGGKTYTNATPEIAGTTDDVLFHTEYSTETGSESFDVPVDNGQYEVVLHFAEIYFQSPGASAGGGIGSRVFDVEVEGTLELDDYDIIEDVGSTTAVSHSYLVDVADGQVDIDLTSVVNQAKISAIEILPN